jgi:hypothetical protein
LRWKVVCRFLRPPHQVSDRPILRLLRLILNVSRPTVTPPTLCSQGIPCPVWRTNIRPAIRLYCWPIALRLLARLRSAWRPGLCCMCQKSILPELNPFALERRTVGRYIWLSMVITFSPCRCLPMYLLRTFRRQIVWEAVHIFIPESCCTCRSFPISRLFLRQLFHRLLLLPGPLRRPLL